MDFPHFVLQCESLQIAILCWTHGKCQDADFCVNHVRNGRKSAVLEHFNIFLAYISGISGIFSWHISGISWHISGIFWQIFLAYLAYFLGIYYTWSATNLLFGEIVFLFLSYLLLRRVCNIFLHMLQSVFVARNDGFNYRLWFLCSSTVLCSMSKIK